MKKNCDFSFENYCFFSYLWQKAQFTCEQPLLIWGCEKSNSFFLENSVQLLFALQMIILGFFFVVPPTEKHVLIFHFSQERFPG